MPSISGSSLTEPAASKHARFDMWLYLPSADNKKEKQDLQEELKKVQHDKEQVALDLSAMERSFSELFKRLEKHKEVIEGYKKVSGGFGGTTWSSEQHLKRSQRIDGALCAPERRDVKEVCSGLPGQNQERGATLSGTESPC